MWQLTSRSQIMKMETAPPSSGTPPGSSRPTARAGRGLRAATRMILAVKLDGTEVVDAKCEAMTGYGYRSRLALSEASFRVYIAIVDDPTAT